jgi:hypothetical protein
LRKRRRKTDTRATQGATWASSTRNHATPAASPRPCDATQSRKRRSQAGGTSHLAARTAGTAARERRARSSQTQTQRCTCAAACARARARLSSRAPARSGSQRSTGAAAAMRRLGAVGRKQSELGRSFRPSAANVVLIYCIGPAGGTPAQRNAAEYSRGTPLSNGEGINAPDRRPHPPLVRVQPLPLEQRPAVRRVRHPRVFLHFLASRGGNKTFALHSAAPGRSSGPRRITQRSAAQGEDAHGPRELVEGYGRVRVRQRREPVHPNPPAYGRQAAPHDRDRQAGVRAKNVNVSNGNVRWADAAADGAAVA